MSRVAKAFRKGVKVSERHGAGEWSAERWTSVALVPLTLWALWSAVALTGGGYDGALSWFARPETPWLLSALWLITLWHMAMGVKVIVDDYIHRPSSRNLLLGLNSLAGLVLAAAGVFFIVRLAVGSAPLPAGFGI